MRRHFLPILLACFALAACGSDDETNVAPSATPTSVAPTSTSTRTSSPVPTPSFTATLSPTVVSGTSTPTPSIRFECLPTGTSTRPSGTATPTFFAPTPRFLTVPNPTPPDVVSDYWPRFSPDGSTIIFTRTITNTETQQSAKAFLLTIAADGSGEAHEFPPPGPTRTPIPVGATRSSWSWNTSLTQHQIAFTGTSDDGAFLYLISDDGSGLDKITPEGTSTQVYYPSWYPDGVKVAVVDYSDTGANGVLRRIDTQANTQVQLTDGARLFAGEPAVSRDGTRIAFPAQFNCNGVAYNQDYNSIWVLDLSTSNPRVFDPYQGRTPDWSPDDANLSFETTRFCADGRYAIIIEGRDAPGGVQATDCAYDGNHSIWSPDGTKIAFSAVIPGTKNRDIAIFDVPAPPQ